MQMRIQSLPARWQGQGMAGIVIVVSWESWDHPDRGTKVGMNMLGSQSCAAAFLPQSCMLQVTPSEEPSSVCT